MSIISKSILRNDLPDDADDSNKKITNAVYEGSAITNSFAKQYYPFENFDTTTGKVRAPYDAVFRCKNICKVVYFLSIGEVFRDGEQKETWSALLETYKQDLMVMSIEPTWEEQTITLDDNDSMLIGTNDGGVGYPQVLPFTALIEDGAEDWVLKENFTISKGGLNDEEKRNAWYLRGDTASVDGTLKYQRTYRLDMVDYMRYQA